MSQGGVATTGFVILTVVYSGVAEAAPLLLGVIVGGSALFLVWCIVATLGVAGFTTFLYVRLAKNAATEKKWGVLRDIVLAPVCALVVALVIYVPARAWWVDFTNHTGSLAGALFTFLMIGAPPLSALILRNAPEEGAAGTAARWLTVYPLLTASITTWFAITLNSLSPI